MIKEPIREWLGQTGLKATIPQPVDADSYIYSDGSCVSVSVTESHASPNIAETPMYYCALHQVAQNPQSSVQVLNKVATLLKDLGRYQDVEALCLRALDGRESTLGKDHPDTLISVGNLAGLHQAQGRLEQAGPLMLRDLEGNESTLGKDHPDTLTLVYNLARLYEDQGRLEQAEPLFFRELKGIVKRLGKDHPDALVSITDMAKFYVDQGRFEEARTLKATYEM